jgi:hypothetical protein
MRDDDRSLEPAMAPLLAITCSRAGHWSRTFSDLTRNWANGHGCLIRSRSYALPFVVFALGLLFTRNFIPEHTANGNNSGTCARTPPKLCQDHILPTTNPRISILWLRQRTGCYRGFFWPASCDVEEACCSAPAKESDLHRRKPMIVFCFHR